MKNKYILITGGAGYIGSHIAFTLTRQGYQVLILDNLSHGQQWPHNWAHFILGDCADTQLVHSLFTQYPIDTVIHCAGSIEVSESIAQPISYYLNNVSVTLNLLQLMIMHKIPRIIFSSTCAAYGQPEQIPMSEDHPLQPLSPYGSSKVMIERILKDAQVAYGLSYIIFRYFNAAGALPEYNLGEQHNPETHAIARLLQAAFNSSPFNLFGSDYNTPDGTCIRDYTHVIDIANAHSKAIDYLNAGGQSDIFNLGAGKGTSVHELIDAVQSVTQSKIKIIPMQRREGDSPILVADTQKAQLLLQWKAQHSDIYKIIQSAAQFMRSQEYAQFVNKKEPLDTISSLRSEITRDGRVS